MYYARAYSINAGGTAYGTQVLITTLPNLTTTAVTGITPIAASSGGTIAVGGAATVTARGVCWNTAPGPTTANPKTTDGSGTGAFVSTLSPLLANTPYYVRAYATNAGGTNYGNEVSFSTLPATAPVVASTTAATAIASTVALSGGVITNDGGAGITARGVCWSTITNPTIADSKTTDAGTTGTFISKLSGMTPNTPYFARAYATNSVGTAYGNEITFTTSATIGVGDPYQGGVIAYLFVNGDPGYVPGQTHGYIASIADLGNAFWSNNANSITTSESMGTGIANTNAIVANQGTGTYAARLCYDYVNTETGTGVYSDWYLAAFYELDKVQWNRIIIGGFIASYYWTSSQYTISNSADARDFNTNYNSAGLVKLGNNIPVRAIRNF